MAKELSQEEIETIKSGGIAKFEAMVAWQYEHKEEVDTILDNAAGVLALFTSSLEQSFPVLALCPKEIVVGAFQAAYLAGHLNGAEMLKLDNLTK